MKLTVKTLKGSHFQITAQSNLTIMAVKKSIEDVQGKDSYPCGQQLLIFNGKVLKDESTLAENNVSEDGFLVVMLSKGKISGPSGLTSSQPAPVSTSVPNPTDVAPPQQLDLSDPMAEAASTLVGGCNLDRTIQQLTDMGGGSWDKATVIRALRAAYSNPERAVDYLYSGIPDNIEVSVPLIQPDINSLTATGTAHPLSGPGAPNSAPLNLFPQEAISGAAGAGLGTLDFLRNNAQFQALRSMVHTNPEILQPMLQELGKQNPSLLGIIQENHQEFLNLINEPMDGSGGDIFDQADQDMPQAVVNVTPAEQEAIERMESMGFERDRVIEAFLACDRNEELAVNYLLENGADFQD